MADFYVYIPLTILVIVWGLYGLWLLDSWLASHMIKRLRRSQPPSKRLTSAVKMFRRYGFVVTLYKVRNHIAKQQQ